MPKRKTTKEFVIGAIIKHGNRYDYSKVKYINDYTHVDVICKEHGIFSQVPSSHLQGIGCNKCGIKAAGYKQLKSINIFINEASIIHNNKYTYTAYKGAHIKIIIKCPLHGEFSQTPHDHLKGHGCSICGNFKKLQKYHNRPTILYYFKIKNTWKIGITTRDLKIRYKQDYSDITELFTWKFNTGKEAFKYEQSLLELNKQFTYSGPTPFTDGTGTTECFIKDIKMITEYNPVWDQIKETVVETTAPLDKIRTQAEKDLLCSLA